MPEAPPNFPDLVAEISETDPPALVRALTNSSPVDNQGRYLHWDQVRRRTPPASQSHEEWWLSLSAARRALRRSLPLLATDGSHFQYANVDSIQQAVHTIDQQASGQILAEEVVTNLRSSDRYLVSSLIEEAITSSQLEGASTTRRAAKELLQTGRKPRTRSEQMIVNNYNAMLAAEELARSEDGLTPTHVLDLHRIVTDGAIDDPGDSGRLQTADEERISVLWPNSELLLHQPPPVEKLPARLEQLCAFANGELDEGFVHPVVRAIVVHFGLAYDHPFVDGNGRTARALFYWSMLRSGYWLSQYLSISSILRKAPAQYARSYLYTETDDNDLTYFILYQLDVITRAINSLEQYLSRKVAETRDLEQKLRGSSALNHRQLAMVGDALRDSSKTFTFRAQARRHNVTYQSARTDLLGLVKLGLFDQTRVGRQFHFRAVPDIADRLQTLE